MSDLAKTVLPEVPNREYIGEWYMRAAQRRLEANMKAHEEYSKAYDEFVEMVERTGIYPAAGPPRCPWIEKR